MNPLPSSPELSRFGGSALVDVLQSFLALSATESPTVPESGSTPEPCLNTTVAFQGDGLSGMVQLQVPEAFARLAADALLGSEESSSRTDTQLRDLCGELTNMIAGRVAADLRSRGHRCTLGTPETSYLSTPPANPDPARPPSGRSEWRCQDFRLCLDVRCHPSPA